MTALLKMPMYDKTTGSLHTSLPLVMSLCGFNMRLGKKIRFLSMLLLQVMEHYFMLIYMVYSQQMARKKTTEACDWVIGTHTSNKW